MSFAIFWGAIKCRINGLNVELGVTDAEVRRLVESVGAEAETLPLILFPDGERLPGTAPSRGGG